jgi:hypothetical protein
MLGKNLMEENMMFFFANPLSKKHTDVASFLVDAKI